MPESFEFVEGEKVVVADGMVGGVSKYFPGEIVRVMKSQIEVKVNAFGRIYTQRFNKNTLKAVGQADAWSPTTLHPQNDETMRLVNETTLKRKKAVYVKKMREFDWSKLTIESLREICEIAEAKLEAGS